MPTMPDLASFGTPIDAATLPKLSHVEDLELYDGPLLSEFVDTDGEPWLYYWVDSDETLNRWVVCRVIQHDLKRLKAHDSDANVLRAVLLMAPTPRPSATCSS